MDYVFWASTYAEDILKIMVSYDVGCQWKIHLHERKKGMPTLFVPARDGVPEIEVSLPVWHGGVHNDECAMCESLRYKSGAGMVDGEGVERVWSTTNPRAYATREMHMNNRHASLEDHFDNQNFLKNLGMGAFFLSLRFVRRLINLCRSSATQTFAGRTRGEGGSA